MKPTGAKLSWTAADTLRIIALQGKSLGGNMRSAWFAVSIGAVLATANAQAAALSQNAQIRVALSAAPPAIAAHAGVVAHDMKGATILLRKGSNGWTCMPPSSGAGADPEPRPACFDANGLAFMTAFGAGHAPDPDKPGYSYMLQGGSGWSNTDPAATKLPPGRKDYIHIPPHFMVLSAKMANESGLPLHESDPDTHRPFVMFGGTPFALMIVPVK